MSLATNPRSSPPLVAELRQSLAAIGATTNDARPVATDAHRASAPAAEVGSHVLSTQSGRIACSRC